MMMNQRMNLKRFTKPGQKKNLRFTKLGHRKMLAVLGVAMLLPAVSAAGQDAIYVSCTDNGGGDDVHVGIRTGELWREMDDDAWNGLPPFQTVPNQKVKLPTQDEDVSIESKNDDQFVRRACNALINFLNDPSHKWSTDRYTTKYQFKHFKIGDWVMAPYSGGAKKRGTRIFEKQVPAFISNIVFDKTKSGKISYEMYFFNRDTEFERKVVPATMWYKFTKIVNDKEFEKIKQLSIHLHKQCNYSGAFTDLKVRFKLWCMQNRINVKLEEIRNDLVRKLSNASTRRGEMITAAENKSTEAKETRDDLQLQNEAAEISQLQEAATAELKAAREQANRIYDDIEREENAEALRDSDHILEEFVEKLKGFESVMMGTFFGTAKQSTKHLIKNANQCACIMGAQLWALRTQVKNRVERGREENYHALSEKIKEVQQACGMFKLCMKPNLKGKDETKSDEDVNTDNIPPLEASEIKKLEAVVKRLEKYVALYEPEEEDSTTNRRRRLLPTTTGTAARLLREIRRAQRT